MPRRERPEKRIAQPDLKYGNVHVSMFVNRLMYGGKKSTAQRVLYDSFDLVEQRAKRPPVEVFEQAITNVTPQIEVKARRVGGSTYQVPTPVDSRRQLSLAMRWLLAAARGRGGRSMSEKLANEFMDAATKQGAAVKRRDDTHRMADANRAFSHFRF
ncbi:SSU ribosomal protein S7p (S5e) [hydrothermal vent metagenome]|uniref:SSU ribosomal protein S7p (S5e) n=1 Tax=hydrothermal vent metagenome TaxID=652676 RepID=A0A3B0VKV6_9ZZZZ